LPRAGVLESDAVGDGEAGYLGIGSFAVLEGNARPESRAINYGRLHHSRVVGIRAAHGDGLAEEVDVLPVAAL